MFQAKKWHILSDLIDGTLSIQQVSITSTLFVVFC